MTRSAITVWSISVVAAAVVVGLWLSLKGPAVPERPVEVLPYASEYPEIGYARTTPGQRLARLAERVAAGDADLAKDPTRGYLDAVLEALDIDQSSQVLVYSRTSLQRRPITPATPRALYFNDDTYVSWVQGARTVELAGMDPELGPVFYQLHQQEADPPIMERQLGSCLRCHDSYSLSGGGVPRFLIGSGYTGTDGELVSHEAWILTSTATPLRSRWGGWYVTGRHGDQVHLGNIVVERPEDLNDLESLRVGNLDDLSGLIDTSPYLTPYSDIVALLVLEHQIEVQNRIARLRFETAGLSADGAVDPEGLAALVEPLVEAMFMVNEATIGAPIEGSTGFRRHFESLGPADAAGRSLRELDLETRVFRYPLSYLIYSDAIDALPDAARNVLFGRIRAVLQGETGFGHLSVTDRRTITEILGATKPEVLTP